MSQTSDDILKTIEEKQITPKPKWQFSLKNLVFWLFFVFSIILGSLTVVTIIFMIADYDWDIYKYLDRSAFEHIFISIPYFWIIVLGLLIFAGYYNFRHTKRGYRQKTIILVFSSIAGSIILGTILFFCGMDCEIHEVFSEQLPYYDNLVHTKEDVWIFPEKGLLSGTITDIQNQNEFYLRDIDGNMWHVEDGNIEDFGNLVFCKGEEIKLIGQLKDDHNFSAKIIRPWHAGNRCNQR